MNKGQVQDELNTVPFNDTLLGLTISLGLYVSFIHGFKERYKRSFDKIKLIQQEIQERKKSLKFEINRRDYRSPEYYKHIGYDAGIKGINVAIEVLHRSIDYFDLSPSHEIDIPNEILMARMKYILEGYSNARIVAFLEKFLKHQINLKDNERRHVTNKHDFEKEIGKEKTAKSRQKPEYNTLKDIFVDDAYKECIEALQNVTPPVIDKNMNYRLGQHQKSVFTAWVEVLKTNGKIQDVTFPQLAKLLNNTFPKLDLSKDGKTIRTPKNTVYRTTAYNKYRTQFTRLIKKIPLNLPLSTGGNWR